MNWNSRYATEGWRGDLEGTIAHFLGHGYDPINMKMMLRDYAGGDDDPRVPVQQMHRELLEAHDKELYPGCGL
jgi:hypothetical protein